MFGFHHIAKSTAAVAGAALMAGTLLVPVAAFAAPAGNSIEIPLATGLGCVGGVYHLSTPEGGSVPMACGAAGAVAPTVHYQQARQQPTPEVIARSTGHQEGSCVGGYKWIQRPDDNMPVPCG